MAIGLIINALNPEGIEFIRKERMLVFENDSLLNVIDSSAKFFNKDSLIQDEKIQTQFPDTEVINKDPINDKDLVKNNKIMVENKNDTKNIVGFEKPKAITLEQAYKLFKQGIVFIDARESEEYAEDHILNAISIPFYEYDENAFKLDSIKKDKPVVVYCAGTDCDLSILLGDQLFEMGYKKTYIFFGGWNEWFEANYPIASEIKQDSTSIN